MNSQQKVIWYEGMALDPHHFQQWDRYHLSVLDSRLRSMFPFCWGVTELEIDKDGLQNGHFSLKSCRGITRDGLVFDIPASDSPPNPRSVSEHFPPTDDRLKVYLAIPPERSDGRNCQLDGAGADRASRFRREFVVVPDDNTGLDERRIGVARTSIDIRFGTEPLEEFNTIQVAEIVRSQDGTFMLSKEYIPPCLSIVASDNLMSIVRRQLESLVAKGNALSERRRRQPSGQIEFTTSDTTVFWLLHTINTFVPVFRHHTTATRCHPEIIYSLMLMLAGQLVTFSANAEPPQFPRYDHGNPGECFKILDVFIRKSLTEVIPKNYLQIPLEKGSEPWWVGRVHEDQLFQTATFYLAVEGDLAESKIVGELGARLKIADPDRIQGLITAALPGLAVRYTPVPPLGAPTKTGLYYFRLDRGGSMWENIMKARAIAVFAPAEFEGMRLDMIAVSEVKKV
jgi:type VI secretion system protein ImpJ